MTVSEQAVRRRLTDIREVRKKVFETVAGSNRKLTPAELEKALSNRFVINKPLLRAAIRMLVADGELAYTYRFGCSFLEVSFNRPIRISSRVVLKPPGAFYRPESDDVVVELQPGASFGSGEHPSTRLAIRGIETALSQKEFFREEIDSRALDIGTGSGVLAIVAVRLGISGAVGVDIDPCAITEARENVRINNLEKRIKIYDQNAEQIDERFFLITANLRYPTLKRLCHHMAERLERGGWVIVSGVKTDELSDLLNVFATNNFRCVWEAFEKDWAGLVFEN